MKEQDIQSLIRLHVSQKTKATLFRNNVGQAYIGKIQKSTTGGVYLENPRLIKFGLGVGSSDLIGWKEVVITPEMVGKKIAVFTTVEVKKPFKHTIKPEQLNFIQRVKEAGGISGLAMSGDEAVSLINNF